MGDRTIPKPLLRPVDRQDRSRALPECVLPTGGDCRLHWLNDAWALGRG
jgi:hypothetical protein